jgi:glycosyltransferase involved in cell wall biosynthesis
VVEKLLRHFETSAVENAEVVTFTSRGAVELFDTDYPGILRKKDVRVIHAGVDVEGIASIPADRGLLRQYGVEGKRLLLSVGPHVPEKGLDVLIEAIAALPFVVRNSLKVLLVGRGPSTEELISLINERDLRDTVRLLAWVPDVIPLMKVADVFVLTPLRTVFDLVFLEAMAAKVPVITTAVGGNLELFDDQSAILLPPSNAAALRDAILKLLDDEVTKTSLAQNAYRRVLKNFTLSKMLEDYQSVYGEFS